MERTIRHWRLKFSQQSFRNWNLAKFKVEWPDKDQLIIMQRFHSHLRPYMMEVCSQIVSLVGSRIHYQYQQNQRQMSVALSVFGWYLIYGQAEANRS